MAFYLYRDGYQIKTAQGDQKMALHLHEKGYELGRLQTTREDAEAEKLAWQKRVYEMREKGLL